MSPSDKDLPAGAVRDAIRIKRERKPVAAADIEALEASLLADIENFDIDAAERQARQEQVAASVAGMIDKDLEFPEIVPVVPPRTPKVPEDSLPPVLENLLPGNEGGLLGLLRQRAAQHQKQEHSLLAKRSATNRLIDESLKYIFFYLHDLVQQLNILKPGIPRSYNLVDTSELSGFAWSEGFADYRTQAQSAGACIELVTLSYQLRSAHQLKIERDGPAVERFRSMLFDYGLQFNCKEHRNERRYLERAEFHVQGQLSVSLRWRADFQRGLLVFETRNLERFGVILLDVRPAVVDFALLEELGKLVLGQPNHFRELAKR